MDNRTTIDIKMPNVDQKSLMSRVVITANSNNANNIIQHHNHNGINRNINNIKESSPLLAASSSSSPYIAHKSSDYPKTTTSASTLNLINSPTITTATLAKAPTAVSSNDNSSSDPNVPTISNANIYVNDTIKQVKDLNEFISCHLCKGYLIDATTIIECLHSFCRTCIIKYFDDETNPKCHSCPKCDTQVHKTKPKLNIRSDPTLQDIVYKLVPGLFKNEMSRRKEFYARFPEKAVGLSNEEKGEINGERLILSHDDIIQITIEYFPEVSNPFKLLPFNDDENFRIKLNNLNQRRYLLCKVGMKVLHLKKFIRSKYELDNTVSVEFFYKHELLKDDYTIMDLAYIYSWRRNMPMSLYYLILGPNKTLEDYLVFMPQSKLSPFSQCRRSCRQTRLMMKRLHNPSPLMRSRSSSLVVKPKIKTNDKVRSKAVIQMPSKTKLPTAVKSCSTLTISSTPTITTSTAAAVPSKATATIMANSLTEMITFNSVVEASSRITNGFKRSSEKTDISSNSMANKKAKIPNPSISDNGHHLNNSSCSSSGSSNNTNGPSKDKPDEVKNDIVSEVKFLAIIDIDNELPQQAPEDVESVANEVNVNEWSESKFNENLDPFIKQDSSNSTDSFLNNILREVEERVIQMNGLPDGETQHITTITGIKGEKESSFSMNKSTPTFNLKNPEETATNGVLSSKGPPSNGSMKNGNYENVILTPESTNKNSEPKMQNGTRLADMSLHINGTHKNDRSNVVAESLLKKTNDEIKSTIAVKSSSENDTNVNNHHHNSSGTTDNVMDKSKNNLILKSSNLLETFLKGDLNGGDGPKNFQEFQKLLYSTINNNCNMNSSDKNGTDSINQTIESNTSIKNNDINGNNVQLNNHNHH